MAGLLAPSAGAIEVLGDRPAEGPEQRARVGFVAQDTPTYDAEHRRAPAARRAAELRWDDALARERIARLGLDPAQKARRLSGGQRAQLALTLGIAKRPRLLLLDEPVASLDPLNRREFLQSLMEAVAEHELSVVLSSHLVSDLERVCDFLIVLVASRVQLAEDLDRILATHHRLIGPRAEAPEYVNVINTSHTERQSTLLVRTAQPILDPAWTVSRPTLEDVVLAYMERRVTDHAPRAALEVVR